MKILKIFILLLLLAGISLLGEILTGKNIEKNNSIKGAKRESVKKQSIKTDYRIKMEFDASNHSIGVNEIITWNNFDSEEIDSIFLNLPVSSRINNDDYSKLNFEIERLKIDNKPLEFEYVTVTEKNFIDSSLILVKLDKSLSQNKSIEIEATYKINLPKERRWSDAQFYNFENWYVTVSPFINEKFIAYPTHNYIKSFLEYSNYDVNILVPNEFSVAMPGSYQLIKNGTSNIYRTNEKELPNFNWFMFNDLTKYSNKIVIDSHEILVDIFLKDSKENYVERYVKGVKNYLTTLSDYATYPFDRITIVDIPSVEEIKNKSYTNLVAIKTDLISPVKTQKFEYKLALAIAEQYFGVLTNPNSLENLWLSKGISAFVAEKLVRKYYGDLYSYFNVAKYYPVYGLHFMSFRSIPLIYVISEDVIPEGARDIKKYYSNLIYGNTSIPTYLLPNYSACEIASVIKPKISLLTMEKFIGSEEMGNRLLRYFKNHEYGYPNNKDFLSELVEVSSRRENAFFNDLFTTDKRYDYAVTSVENIKGDNYEITVERIEDGVYPILLSVITEDDILKLNWNGKERYKVFKVKSSSNIISAEIDSEIKNLLDLNFANNSYVVESKYWGSISYATRVFFWFQNALMLFGG